MDKMREIPKKNYYILAIVSILTVFVVVYCSVLYKTNQEYKNGEAYITTIVSELKEEELKSYLLDNPNIVVYFSSSKDKNAEKFEKEFKNYIIKKELTNEVVYINTDTIVNQDFYQDVVNTYFSGDLKQKNINLNCLPNMVVFKDGKVKDVLIKYNNNINMDNVKNFFKTNEITQ